MRMNMDHLVRGALGKTVLINAKKTLETLVGSKKTICHIFWSLNFKLLKLFVNPYLSLISLTLNLTIRHLRPKIEPKSKFQILLPEFRFRKLINLHIFE